MSECNCGAATEGKWADVHTEGCPALYVTDGDGPAARARRLVGSHIAKHGPIRGAEALIEEIAAELAFIQFANLYRVTHADRAFPLRLHRQLVPTVSGRRL
jgi:hypothetical protein